MAERDPQRDRAILERILRPAGGGVYVVSTGLAEQQALMRAIYGAEDVQAGWAAALDRLADARVVVLGVPSDVGAGFTRGANRAPADLRAHTLGHPMWTPDVLDLGDVRVVPQLLSDDMLSPAQIAATREALYGDDALGAALPVSPLDLCARALRIVYRHAPDAAVVVLGGDHSVAWPAFKEAFRHFEERRGRTLGLLHFDAHTDLLPERLGVKYCFATWARHAARLMGADGRLVQVGIRASGRTRGHWEPAAGVRQLWMAELEGRSAADVADEIGAHLAARGVDALYVSNDIDGTDPAYAAATGTPEPGGLHPDFVSELVHLLADRFPLVAGDLVEVAPPLAHEVAGEPGRTLDTAARYLADLVDRGGRGKNAGVRST
ncbi:MAG: arginase family protein [bacterium]